jgi:hypothetical protein
MPIPGLGYGARKLTEKIGTELGWDKDAVKWVSRAVGLGTSLVLFDIHGGFDALTQLVQDPTAVDLTAVDPTMADPTAVDPTMADPTGAGPAIADSTVTELPDSGVPRPCL